MKKANEGEMLPFTKGMLRFWKSPNWISGVDFCFSEDFELIVLSERKYMQIAESCNLSKDKGIVYYHNGEQIYV